MSGFQTTLDVLLRSTNRGALTLLSQVLVHGDPTMRRQTVRRLLESTNGRRQVLLLRHFDTLDDALAETVVENVGRLGAAMRQAMGSRRPDLQRAALRVIGETSDMSLAYLVAEATASGDQTVRAEAVDLLCGWTLNLRKREMAAAGPAETMLGAQFNRRRRFVLEALAKAFAMRQAVDMPRVLQAAAMLADDSASWFWSAMAMRRDGRRRRLFQVLGEEMTEELFGFVVRALERDSTGAEAVELLQRPLDRKPLAALLQEFTRHPHLSATAAARLKAVPWLSPGCEALEQLSGELVANALSLAAQSGMPSGRLAALCRALAVGHGDGDVRRMAIEALAHCGAAAAGELQLVATHGPRPSAALAILHMVRRNEFQSPADQMVANLLRDWWAIEAAQRREIGPAMRLLLGNRPSLVQDHLAAGGPACMAALSLIRHASASNKFAARLVDLAGDESDSRRQSAAVSAITECVGEDVARTLNFALGASDSRVRANAVEAFDRRRADVEVFLPFVRDANNRVRANAALALLERGQPEGQETLREMLSAGVADRISALWVFSKARPNGFTRTAELLSRRDPSSRVRRRAAQLLASA